MKACVICWLAFLLGASLAWGQQPEGPGSRSAIDGFEVLTRGPVHEAFAETVSFNPEPGIVAPEVPPAAIEELPPEQRPEGANVVWIPGYWAWDDERTDFLWVSGIWRALPPGRQWVPGYWGRAAAGAQWTSGYWADSIANEVEYLPEPPVSVEAGPNVPAASADDIWLPGCWLWQQNHYAWRPGYWAAGQSDWDWVPAHYVWTPRGYVFVDGYYDYTVAQRGLLFAPVYFNREIYSQRDFSYSPAAIINPAVFASHLFVRPSYGHYYFGDYYGSNYSSNGFSPWFSFNASRSGYDPFYAQQRWQHRADDQWNRQLQDEFTHRRNHEDARPARTYTAQQLQQGSNDRPPRNMSSVIALHLDQFRLTKENSIRLKQLNDDDRQQFGLRGREVESNRLQRQQLEILAPDLPARSPVRAGASARMPLPKSPFVARRPDELDLQQRPPKLHSQPQLDPKLVPRPRPQKDSKANASSEKLPESVEPKATPRIGQKPTKPDVEKPNALPTKGKKKDKTKDKP